MLKNQLRLNGSNSHDKIKYRKTKLKTTKRKQLMEIRQRGHTRNGAYTYDKWLAVIPSFPFKKRTQDWNDQNRELSYSKKNLVYINETMQSFLEYLKDLFCVDYYISFEIVATKEAMSGNTMMPSVHWKDDRNIYRGKKSKKNPGGWECRKDVHIVVGGKGGVLASTVVHEFLHASGFDHEWQINGYTNYRSMGHLDRYSNLIVRDIFGRDEVLLQ